MADDPQLTQIWEDVNKLTWEAKTIHARAVTAGVDRKLSPQTWLTLGGLIASLQSVRASIGRDIDDLNAAEAAAQTSKGGE